MKAPMLLVHWEVPIREETCPGPSVLWHRVASSFSRRLNLPVSPPGLQGGQPARAQPSPLPWIFSIVGKRSSYFSTRP